MKKVPLTVVILTYNEEENIRQVLDNIYEWVDTIFILDSGSDDRTLEIIAEYHDVKLFHRNFDNYSAQRNYAIKNLPHEHEWMLFLDADEYLTNDLKDEIGKLFNDSIFPFDGYILRRRFYFMGKWIKHGGYYPTEILRLFKHEKASCEREINEHIFVQGQVGKLKFDFIDSNNKDFSFWLNKHNKYSSFEATQFSITNSESSNILGNQAERKKWIRERIWNSLMPPLIRPFIYFIYRYIFRFGFLDGKIGFIYHFMHGLCYRFIIDVKYLESQWKQRNSTISK